MGLSVPDLKGWCEDYRMVCVTCLTLTLAHFKTKQLSAVIPPLSPRLKKKMPMNEMLQKQHHLYTSNHPKQISSNLQNLNYYYDKLLVNHFSTDPDTTHENTVPFNFLKVPMRVSGILNMLNKCQLF